MAKKKNLISINFHSIKAYKRTSHSYDYASSAKNRRVHDLELALFPLPDSHEKCSEREREKFNVPKLLRTMYSMISFFARDALRQEILDI